MLEKLDWNDWENDRNAALTDGTADLAAGYRKGIAGDLIGIGAALHGMSGQADGAGAVEL